MGIFDNLSRTNLRVSKSPYVLRKDRPTGERELFDLTYNAKHEGSWVHIMGADTWINLATDYRRTIADNAVRYQVTSRPLANTILDANLVFYHTHPQKAF